jgi:[acyl-carrier-protein] S-malonyltransferase
MTDTPAKTALLFPGQGSQKPGMGKDLFDAYQVAKDTFQEADDALGYSISKICFDGPAEELNLTYNGQPAILATSIAALRCLESERGPLSYEMAAGHSLGEWSALVAVGALEFADALKLVHLRGKAMQEAVPVGVGSMAAIMGMELAALNAICEEAREGEVCSPANLNGGNQIVISGHKTAIDRAVALAKAQKSRAIPLKVSAPFHCQLMAPAAEKVAEALETIVIGAMKVPVVANVDAAPNQDSGRVKELLVKQVTGTVRWQESVEYMADQGVTRAIELGHGSVIKGLVRRIAKELVVHPIGNSDDIKGLES